MGKRIIAQARGKGGPRYKAPSFKYKGAAKHKSMSSKDSSQGMIMDFIKCRGHSAPLALVQYEDGEFCLNIAPEGITVGDSVYCGSGSEVALGNTLALKDIPEGTLVYNIEKVPGDGGKFCRSSGTFARIVSKLGNKVTVQMPSKKRKDFLEDCRASVGIVAAGGRSDKPFLKAGKKHFAMKAKNKLYPRSSGNAMNAVDHPLGNKRSSRKAKAKPVSRHAPPGRKVGYIAARRTGRKKGKRA